MRRICLWILMFLVGGAVYAQKVTVSGRVLDVDNMPVVQATVQALTLPDSTYVNGCVTNPDGKFTLPALKAGKYALKFSFVGYVTQVKGVTLSASKPSMNIGTVKLSEDAIMLKEAVVVAQAAQVEVKEDTVQYNVAAYRVPEGSAIEELVKKIPGAEVDEDGKITLNGKDISKILVNGKEFFSGDTKVAMKNLTVDMIEKIKAYDKKSDLARITGIDDGEEEAVLDLTVKKGMNKGVFGNVDLAGGTEDRYLGKMMVNQFADNRQFSLMGNLNNTNDMGFPGGGGGFRMGGSNGLNAKKLVGFNFAYENAKLETGGYAQYNFSDADVWSKTASETFLETGNSFANSMNLNRNKSKSLSLDYRLEWKPDSMTNIIFRPRASFSSSDSWGNTTSATFNSDPYAEDGITDPLSQLDLISKAILVNSQKRSTLSDGNNSNVSGELQVNRKLGTKGRNITLRATGRYADSESNSFSENFQEYFQLNDSTSYLNRYTTTPTKNYSYSAQLTYSEPIARAVFLQFSYKYTHQFSKSDRSTYDLSELLNGEPIGFLPTGYQYSLVTDLSKYVENNYDNHDFSANVRWIRPKWQLNVGATWQPQHSKTYYQAGGDDMLSMTRDVENFSPTFDFRYNFSKMSRLRINYRGTASQPSISNLLPITDDSDPLNISSGNPGLKPSFTNRFRLFYNTYEPEHQRGIMTHVGFTTTSNSVSTKVFYDSNTGGRVSMPENINGDWNANGVLAFNTALKDRRFTIGTFTRASFRHQVSYYTEYQKGSSDGNVGQLPSYTVDELVDMLRDADAQKNVTKTTTIGERLNLGFRHDVFDVSLTGNIEYNATRNKFQPNNNMDTYNFSYGVNGNLNLPWNMTFSTDLTQSSRRGYSDASFNTNELVWNAQITQSFLRGNAASLSLQFFDILRQQSNISRAITAMQRSDTEYNAINSYAMLHFSYRLNLMGGKDARSRMEQRGWGGGPGPGRGPRPGGFGRPH